MIDMILNFLAYALLFFQIACLAIGVIVLILAVLYIQATEGKEAGHE